MVLMASFTEKCIMLNRSADTIYVVLLSIITAISFMGSFQWPALVAFALSCVYKLCRHYKAQPFDQWIHSSIYFVTAVVIMAVLARANIERQIELFSEKRHNRSVTQLTESLVHVFHDGIIVTHEQDIVYCNKQTR